MHTAYSWHMRAATWATNRDIAAARLSWERARRSPTPYPPMTQTGQRCASPPRTMLCGTAFRVHQNVAGDRFDELRELCAAAGDKASLAIAMAGLVMDHVYQGRSARRRDWHRKPGPHRVGRRSDLDGGAIRRG